MGESLPFGQSHHALDRLRVQKISLGWSGVHRRMFKNTYIVYK
jgi:hypothetical protein